MTPRLRPSLVNGRLGDPALFVEVAHERGAVLLDLGDLSGLSARDLLRVDAVGVSHMHIDHLFGFDALLRVHVGRNKAITMVGPAGLAACIRHKLAGYSWDLVGRYAADLMFEVRELVAPDRMTRTRFRFLAGFTAEPLDDLAVSGGVVLETPGWRLRAATLEHHGPCLGFALAEPVHLNVWRNRVDEAGLAVGPWLQPLKRAIAAGLADDTAVDLPDGRSARLGELRHLVSVERGQKIGYVTDVRDTPANRAAIQQLCAQADTFFIEAPFPARDAARAADRAHLTTVAAGEIARACGARRVEPFHLSPRYADEEPAMVEEVRRAFAGER